MYPCAKGVGSPGSVGYTVSSRCSGLNKRVLELVADRATGDGLDDQTGQHVVGVGVHGDRRLSWREQRVVRDSEARPTLVGAQ